MIHVCKVCGLATVDGTHGALHEREQTFVRLGLATETVEAARRVLDEAYSVLARVRKACPSPRNDDEADTVREADHVLSLEP